MRELKTLREGFDEVAREERRSAEQLTIEQSVSLFVSLCRDMVPQMEETEDAFLTCSRRELDTPEDCEPRVVLLAASE
jgi:hypothetical protein